MKAHLSLLFFVESIKGTLQMLSFRVLPDPGIGLLSSASKERLFRANA